MKIYTAIKCSDDCNKLQIALNKINNWCTSNSLPLNPSKCNVMSFSLKHNVIKYDYSIDEVSLHRPNTIRDLGVIFDSNLSFTHHINDIVTNSFRSLGFVIRNTREFNDINTIKLLYCALVRPRVEYASIIWCPHYNIHVQNIERVQRRFLKYLSFKDDNLYPPIGFPHKELLSRHSFDALENRRIIAQLVFLRNLITNDIDSEEILSQLNFSTPHVILRQSPTFNLQTPRINVMKFSPLHQICNNYNSVQTKFDLFNCNVALIKNLKL